MRGRLLPTAAKCLAESSHGVEFPSGEPAADFFDRDGSRVELIRDLSPLKRRGTGGRKVVTIVVTNTIIIFILSNLYYC
jgi:hypothetical protein